MLLGKEGAGLVLGRAPRERGKAADGPEGGGLQAAKGRALAPPRNGGSPSHPESSGTGLPEARTWGSRRDGERGEGRWVTGGPGGSGHTQQVKVARGPGVAALTSSPWPNCSPRATKCSTRMNPSASSSHTSKTSLSFRRNRSRLAGSIAGISWRPAARPRPQQP